MDLTGEKLAGHLDSHKNCNVSSPVLPSNLHRGPGLWRFLYSLQVTPAVTSYFNSIALELDVGFLVVALVTL